MNIIKSYFLMLCFCFTGISVCFAQNYFYTNIKVPFLEYLAYTASQSNNDPNNTTAGLFFNAGYSVNFTENFYTEIGLDYLVRSTVRNKFYNKTDLINASAQFEAQKSAFAIQLKPLYKVSTNADENNFFTFGLGINFQKLYSKGMFTNFNKNQNPSEEIRISKSNFHAVLQPEITFILKTDKQVGYRLGLAYSYINWDRASSNFNFRNNINFVIPSNKTSNLFLTGGFIF